MERWAAAKKINTLSFWALQRDNGTCPGTVGAGACSGVAQADWTFSHAFEPFGRPGRPRFGALPAQAAPHSAPRHAVRGSRM